MHPMQKSGYYLALIKHSPHTLNKGVNKHLNLFSHTFSNIFYLYSLKELTNSWNDPILYLSKLS